MGVGIGDCDWVLKLGNGIEDLDLGGGNGTGDGDWGMGIGSWN